MTRFHHMVSQSLEEIGEKSDICLGRRPATGGVNGLEEWRDRLLLRLYREVHIQKWLLLSILVACLVLFVLGLFLLLYHGCNASTYQLVFGGGALASMLMVLNMARQVLSDKAAYDILIAILPDLPPENVVTALKNLKYQRPYKP